ARSAGVVEGKSTGLHVLRLELLVARAVDQVVQPDDQLGEPQLVGVLQDRDDQSVRDGDRDAKVDVALEDHTVIAPRRVEPWELLQRREEDLCNKWQVRERDSMASAKAVFLRIAIPNQVGHVELLQRPCVR